MRTLKKAITATALTAGILAGGAALANAETVYFRGDPVNWEHGRSWGVFSYSDVFTHKYTHSATANNSWSGWKPRGQVAHASQFVGPARATAYWDCK